MPQSNTKIKIVCKIQLSPIAMQFITVIGCNMFYKYY